MESRLRNQIPELGYTHHFRMHLHAPNLRCAWQIQVPWGIDFFGEQKNGRENEDIWDYGNVELQQLVK